MRILGLDFGSKTVGVAVSDELMLTAQGLEIVKTVSEQAASDAGKNRTDCNRISGGAHCARLSQEYEQYRGRALREDERVCTDAGAPHRAFCRPVGRETYDSCSRPAHDGEWNTQRESQTVCG